MKNTENKIQLSKAVKVATASLGLIGMFASTSAFAALTCDIGSSRFSGSSLVVKNIVIDNPTVGRANNIEVTLTFDKNVTFNKAWGDVEREATTVGNTITFTATSDILSGGSIDFGFKGRNNFSASSVSCTAVADRFTVQSTRLRGISEAPLREIPLDELELL